MRLIDLDAFLGKVREILSAPDYLNNGLDWEGGVRLARAAALDCQPVDAVEVVRCKDCALNGLAHCPLSIIENRELIFINHDPEFYCGYGERKE